MNNRHLISLCETISDDYHLNQEIETALAIYPIDGRAIVLDALEAIMNAGPAGIDSQDLIDEVWTIWEGEPRMRELLNQVVDAIPQVFPFCVIAHGDRYVWDRPAATTLVPDASFSAAISNQVNLTDHVLGLMKQLGTFTKSAIVAQLSQQMQIPPANAEMFVSHAMDTLRSAIKPVQGMRDTYRYVETKAKSAADHLAFLRSLGKKD